MKKVFDRIASYLTQSPTRFFFVAAIAAFFVLWFVNAYRDPDGFSWHDVIVESHGLLFDLIVFGVLLSVYDVLREKRSKIERLLEEIEDYRGWNEKEATFRIVGAIRRLNKEGVSKINLTHCFLKDADLSNANLQGTTFTGSNLQGTNFFEANLQNSTIIYAQLQEANFQGAQLQSAIIGFSDMQGANLKGVILQNTSFLIADSPKDFFSFKTRVIERTPSPFPLVNVLVENDWFQKLKLLKISGREAIIEKYYLDENSRLQLKQPPQA